MRFWTFITDWQKTAIFKSQMNAKRLHTSPASGKSIGFLPPDVNFKNKTPAFMLEKFMIIVFDYISSLHCNATQHDSCEN